MTRKYRITMTAEQLGTLRKLASAHAPELAATFERALGAGAEEPNTGDEDEPEETAEEHRDRIDAFRAAAMNAIANGAMDGHVAPEAAVSEAAASVEAADDDAELPAAKRGRRRSPLALWAGTKDEEPNDGHPARSARGRR